MATSRPDGAHGSRPNTVDTTPRPGIHHVTDTYQGIPRSAAACAPPPPNTVLRNTFVPPKRPRKDLPKAQSSNPKESNVESGLTILPWEDFIYDPRVLDDLFVLERDGVINYDPDEVNVFFHATRMTKPTFGDVSENGRAWVLTVENVMELEQVRLWLTERISIFGVTLVRKEGTFGKGQRAPCLIIFDPREGIVRDHLYNAFVRSVGAMDHGHKFCIEVNFNGCVENWCTRVTGAKCKAVGAKLIITNGEERERFMNAESIVCCVVCLPVWAIQTGILKAYRQFQYTDIELDLTVEELRLHGSKGGASNQRERLFDVNRRRGVFRTKPSESGVACLDPRRGTEPEGHKYICVKKYDKKDNRPIEETIDEHETTTLQNLLSHITKTKTKHDGTGSMDACVGSVDTSCEIADNLTDDVKARSSSGKPKDNDQALLQAGVQVHHELPRKTPVPRVQLKETGQVRFLKDHQEVMSHENEEQENADARKNISQSSEEIQNVRNKQRRIWDTDVDALMADRNGLWKDNLLERRMETLLLKGYTRSKEVDPDMTSETPKSKRVLRKKSKKRNSNQAKNITNFQNGYFQQDDTTEMVGRHVARMKGQNGEWESDSSDDNLRRFPTHEDDVTCLSQTAENNSYDRELRARQNGRIRQQTMETDSSEDGSEAEFMDYLRDANSKILRNIEQERLFTERHYPEPLKENESLGHESTINPMPYMIPDDDEFYGRAVNIIPVTKTERTYSVDNTDDELDEEDPSGADGDIELTDCELDDEDEDEKEEEQPDASTKKKRPQTGADRSKRPSRYDSTRKYLGIKTQRQKMRPIETESVQHKAVYDMELM